MFINALKSQNTSLYGINIQKKQSFKAEGFNFEPKEDCFVPSVKISESDFNFDISQDDKELIKQSVLQIASDENSIPIGEGADGNAYKINDDYVVKISHNDSINSKGEMRRLKADLKEEVKMLKSVSGFDENSQKYIACFKLNDGRYALVSTLVDGKSPEVGKKEFNSDSLKSMLNLLYKLDEKNILHRDLKMENIKINDKNEAGLLDFGVSINFDPKNFQKNSNENNFPEFELPTNLRNFEDTLLLPYLNELSKTNPKEAKELFTEYLKCKSDFHLKKFQNIIQSIETDSLKEEEKNKLLDAAKYEKTLASVFKNPDNDIIETELLKNNITYNSELAYKNEILLLNPLANVSLKMNALISAKKLEKKADINLNRPNTQEKRDYYEYKKQEARFRQEKIGSWTVGLTNWLVKCLTPNEEQDNECIKNIINQCCNQNKNLSSFEIPNIQNIAGIK